MSVSLTADEVFGNRRHLAPLTTIGMGGHARYFRVADSVSELREARNFAQRERLPFLILGGGSNLLVPDEGFPGLVVHMNMRGINVQEHRDRVSVKLMAGEVWDDFVAFAVNKGWAGVECLSGIPGRTGAAPIQNIGAYGQEIADTITRVEVLDLESLREKTLDRDTCGFQYRHSIFKGEAEGRYAVTAIHLELIRNGRATVRYPDLKKQITADTDLAEVRDTVLKIRREKSMVVDPDDPNSRGCGSFFTNPIVDQETYKTFCQKTSSDHPVYPASAGRVKLSAAWLIENAGFYTGYVHKGVGLSEKHCLAIINRSEGTANQVKELMTEIQKAVLGRFGIELTPEPVIL